MAKTVTFGMTWQMYGHQTITLPDTVNADDPEAVKAYILSVWDHIPCPAGAYVFASDELDQEYIEIG